LIFAMASGIMPGSGADAQRGVVITKAATGGIRDYGLAERLLEHPTSARLAIIGLVFVRAPRPRPAGATAEPSGPTPPASL
jgi:hypothetical protein